MSVNILAADIGGTTSRFAFFEGGAGGRLEIVERCRLPTASAGSFSELLEQLKAAGFSLDLARCDVAAVAIAGPVDCAGVFSAPPNISWSIDLRHIGADLSRVWLLNDFTAQAYACASPAADSAREVLNGRSVPGGTIAVVGAGTGLGKGFLFEDNSGRLIAGASEGGHAAFPVETQEEFEFARFVAQKMQAPYATWDDIVSGRGLALIHEFLHGEVRTPEQIAQTLPYDSDVFEWFSRFYGRVCRCFALEVFAVGGFFIAGGIAAKNPFIVTNEAFSRSFRSARVYQELLASIPVRLITDEENGLWGAAVFARERGRDLFPS